MSDMLQHDEAAVAPRGDEQVEQAIVDMLRTTGARDLIDLYAELTLPPAAIRDAVDDLEARGQIERLPGSQATHPIFRIPLRDRLGRK